MNSKENAMKRIDAHMHCVFDCDWDRIFQFFDERNIVKMNCICGGPNYSSTRIPIYKNMYKLYPDRFSWGTYLPLPDFSVSDGQYASGVIEHLKRDFDAGASSCKAYKNIGMSVKKPDGTFIMIDDPIFDPIFDYIASAGKVLMMHMAEPFPRWPGWPDDDPELEGKKIYGPLSSNPEWEKLDFPGFWEQIQAQENAVRRHPKLKFVCAHLAAVGHDVAKVAEMLDRCPNLAVDTSGRRRDLAVQDTDKVRDFIIKYQDRILWGMDQQNYKVMSELTEPEKDDFYKMMNDGYEFEFNLYESDEIVQVSEFQVPGLDLPEDVLEKIYYKNFEEWFGK